MDFYPKRPEGLPAKLVHRVALPVEVLDTLRSIAQTAIRPEENSVLVLGIPNGFEERLLRCFGQCPLQIGEASG